MGNNPQLSISFAANAGDSEKYWVRLEQVQTRPEAISLADAARLIDAYYNIAPCDTDTFGNGGEAAVDTTITEEDYYKAALKAVDLSSYCAGNQYWEAQVDVLRSHNQPAYVLHNQPATRIRTETVRTCKVEQLSVDKANFVDLSWPCERVLSLYGAVLHSLRGSTLNFTRPVTGLVTVVYESVWDRVTLRVSLLDTDHNMMQAEGQPAAALVFWRGLAAACAVQRPETEELYGSGNMDERVRDKLCNPSGSSSHGQAGGGNCWQNVEHYRLCQCSGSEAPGTWQTVESAECPEDTKAGANVGSRRQLAGYVYCEGEEDDVHDPEYYERVCCKPPPGPLPLCRETRALWNGDAGIEGGAGYYKELYGANVQLIAIRPEGGCGEKVWKWDTPNKDCCQDIIPLSPSPNNPETFQPGESHSIGVLDGKPGELIWEAHGGLYFKDGGRKVYTLRTPSRSVAVYAEDEGTCPEPSIDVDDGCQPLTMTFVGGGANPPTLPDDDIVVAPEQRFTLSASGGVPPLRWQVGGQLELISWDQDTGRTVLLEASEDFCGTEDVEVIDVCGNSAAISIRSTRGTWRAITDFDPYSSPWGGGTPAAYSVGGARYRVDSYNGYRADVGYKQISRNFTTPESPHSVPHAGSCQEALEDVTGLNYTGEIIVIIDGISPPSCTPKQEERGSIDTGGVVHDDTYCYGMCYNVHRYVVQRNRTYETQNTWFAQYQVVISLWKWVCPDGSSTQ